MSYIPYWSERQREHNRMADAAALFIASVLVLGWVVFHGCGCSPSPPTQAHAENTKVSGTYFEQLKSCVDAAGKRMDEGVIAKPAALAESQACRCETNKRYRRDCDDAGDLYTRDGGK